jgi:hypothetical protein
LIEVVSEQWARDIVKNTHLHGRYRANAYRALNVHGGGILLELAVGLFGLILEREAGWECRAKNKIKNRRHAVSTFVYKNARPLF